MQALEVGHLGGVTRLDQGLEAGLDQLDAATAQHGLLAEQVGLGLFAEAGLNHAALGAAVGCGIRQGDVTGLARRVLVDGDQRGHAAALEVLGAHGVARTLGRDHDDVDVLARDDLVVVDVEAVREGQRSTLLEVGRDFGVVDAGHGLVRQQHHHHVGALNGVGDVLDGVTGAFGLGPRRAFAAQTDGHLDARILEVGRVRVALAAVTDDGDALALDEGEVGVFVVIDLHDGFLIINGLRR